MSNRTAPRNHAAHALQLQAVGQSIGKPNRTTTSTTSIPDSATSVPEPSTSLP